jgi:alpha-tubulin suppressor-like RCC1 family protein
VRCWGRGDNGRLGYGNEANIGDNENPSSAGDVAIGSTVGEIIAAQDHTCAKTDSGSIYCWGEGTYGKLGYGNVNSIGDDETPASAGSVVIGGVVSQLSAGDMGVHTCALLETNAIRCWGNGGHGRLGYGNTNNIGDDETPMSAGDVPYE